MTHHTPLDLSTNPIIGMIDIGSSAMRLVIYKVENGYPHIFINERVWTALATGKTDTDYTISDQAIQHLKETLTTFKQTCHQVHCDEVICFATSAFREATNGADMAAALTGETGIAIAILSGAEEARFAALGGEMSVPDRQGMVLDLGGGSLDLATTGADKQLFSLPLGILSLKALSEEQPEQAYHQVSEAIAALVGFADHARGDLIVLGAGMKSLAQLYMAKINYQMPITEGFTVDTADFAAFCQTFMTCPDHPMLADLKPEYRAVLPYRAVALMALMDQGDFNHLIFANFGIREGVLRARFDDPKQPFDPLIAFARDHAAREGYGTTYAMKAGQYLQEQITDIDPRYLMAAALFSGCCWRDHVSKRAERAFDTVYHGAYVGCNHVWRMWLAVVSYFAHADVWHDALLNRAPHGFEESHLISAQKIGLLLRRMRLADPGLRGTFTARDKMSEKQ